jgi:[1-hydroxy-2-(trimethylamino)ethyl]phosphonate dioxygenase
MTAVDEVRELFEGAGGRQYGGERVTQLAHALQCAAAAEAAGAPAPLVVAALLHDVGHLVHDLGPRPAGRGIDDRHEERGAEWLARWFGPDVTELVRLHVDAKRYLCAAEPGYFRGLSPASVCSLALQGGSFDDGGAAAFIVAPHAANAVRLRRWDEAAKVAGLTTPDLAHFEDALRACLRS